jgi:hypothetical protein
VLHSWTMYAARALLVLASSVCVIACVEASEPVLATPLAPADEPTDTPPASRPPPSVPTSPSSRSFTCPDPAAVDEAAAKVAPQEWDGRTWGRIWVSPSGMGSAVFVEATAPELPPRTPQRTATFGSCRLDVYVIDRSEVQAQPPGSDERSAGDLSLTSATTATETCGADIVRAPWYLPAGPLDAPTPAGAPMTIRGSGDPKGVPPFSTTVFAPPKLTSMTPPMSYETGTFVVSRSTDSALSWTADGPGTVTVTLVGSNDPDRLAPTWERHVVRCTADAPAGTLPLDHGLFESAWTGGAIWATTDTETTFAAGRYRIFLRASAMRDLYTTLKVAD